MRAVTLRTLLLIGALSLIVGFPVAGKWARDRSGPRCANDGLKIEPLFRVRVVDADGRSNEFCCVHCARIWLDRSGVHVTAVFVTDESTGAEIDAREAFFVHSGVTTSRVTGNRVHAFGNRAAAEAHLRAFGGSELLDEDRPFHETAGAVTGRIRNR